jgi:hypothetical protein
MRKIMFIGVAILGMMTATISASEVFTFTPDPEDLNDLDHYKWYTWGIDVTCLDARIIDEVELRFENISNWDDDTNILYLHLLDTAGLGVTEGNDDQDPEDHFDGMGPLIDSWVDENGAGTSETLSFFFSDYGLIDDAQIFVLDGLLGIGLDPDCHYFNDGVSLIITASGETATEDLSWSDIKGRF